MPYDKLFNNVELPKAILQSQGLNVYEAIFVDNHHPFCVIEFMVNNQDIYLKMSSSVQKYNKLDHPHLLKIYYWSYEFLLTGNEKIYKFYFVTDHFDKDVKSWLNERNASKLYLFERDIYKIARDLSSMLQYIFKTNLPINPIKRETLVVSNNRIKLIPHVFLLEIAEEMSKIKMLSQKTRDDEAVTKTFFENDLKKMKNFMNTTEEITKILDQTNASKIINSQEMPTSPKKTNSILKKNEGNNQKSSTASFISNLKSDSPKKSLGISSESPKKSNFIQTDSFKKASASPSKNKGLISEFTIKEDEKIAYNSKMKECMVEPKERINSFGVIIAMVAILYDSNDEDSDKILNPANIKDMEKRYGKEFVDLLKKTISKEKNINMNEILDEISYLIKLKGTDEMHSPLDKTKKNINSIIKINIPSERQVKFLHCFPELYQKLLFVNIQDKMQTFFEIQDLNIDFIVPVDHRTISIQKNDQTFIFLLGGKNTNSVYQYNSEKKILEQKENMIGNLERRSFGVCNIRNLIYIAGGYLDNEITTSCECYDSEMNYWCKIKQLNEATTDLSLCSYNDKFLFKFGGQLITLTLCQTIEKYDVSKDRWYIIKYTTEQNIKESFAFSRNSLSLQISENEIIVIGGINVYYEGTNKCITLKIKEFVEEKTKKEQNLLTLMKDKKKDHEFYYEICSSNLLNLPSKDPLELCSPIIVDDELYILQFKKNNQRKLISLSREWKELKDIKW